MEIGEKDMGAISLISLVHMYSSVFYLYKIFDEFTDLVVIYGF